MSPPSSFPPSSAFNASSSSDNVLSDPPANRFSDDPYNNDSNKMGIGYSDEDFANEDLENYASDGIMNSKKSSHKKKRCSTKFKCCLCCLFLLVIVIVIAVTVTNYNKAKMSYSQWRYASLPVPPQDLPTWCSNKDESSQEYNDCLTYCHPADCCTIPPDYAEPGVSCLDPNNPYIDNICNDYRYACSKLDQHDDSSNNVDDGANNNNGDSNNGDDGANNNGSDNNGDDGANNNGSDNNGDDGGNTTSP